MSLILSWLLFPLVLAAIGLGWGALVQWIGGHHELGPLTIPIGWASAIVVAGILTAFSGTASMAAAVTTIGALLGVGYVWGRARLGAAPALAAIGVLFVYGAPVIMSGEATFLGYVRLDDTATWFNLIDQLFSHGRSFSSLPPSTYALNAFTNLGTTTVNDVTGSAYPSGSFMLLGVGHWATGGIDIAWLFQPYLACCAAAVALSIYAVLEFVLDWRWLRAFVAFVAAQSALLFGYAAWGGIKELTAAFLLATGSALAASLVRGPGVRWREVLPLGVVGGALMLTLGGPGAAAYGLPLVLIVFLGLLWHALDPRRRLPTLGALGAVLALGALAAFALGVDRVLVAAAALWLIAMIVIFALPIERTVRLSGALVALLGAAAICGFPLWLVLGHYLSVDQASYNAGQNAQTTLGNLVAPLRAIQIAGIWPAGDFRDVLSGAGSYAAPGWFPKYPLVWLVFIAGAAGVGWTVYKRRVDVAVYVLIALASALLGWADGATPWLLGKALAISSPAILLAGLLGGALLFREEKSWALVLGVVVLAALAGSVIWSNWLQYRDVTLAPRDQLSELETIGAKVAGRGPTFIDEYQIYADRHFLRAGAPVEPAEYRSALLPTVTGALLTKAAWADIDSFPLTTLAPYKSLVIRRSPVESRPPSIYNLVWHGRYYQLYQQPAHPTHRVLLHVPLGDTQLDYCGYAEEGRPFEPLCSVQPAAVPRCSRVKALARQAASDGGELLAYERTNPIVLRATETSWPAGWIADSQDQQSLTPTTPGTAYARISIPTGPHRYQLWLGGSFARGFVVHVDGRYLGSISNELNNIGDYDELGDPMTLGAGVHTIAITYPRAASLAPGSADTEQYTGLDEIALQPLGTPAKMVEVQPPQASELCGRSLDWIEIVAPENG
ncbi:MAG: hypothetical protein ABSC56_02240 [Solirubrobacteraceae bacterium]